jgi:GLPGLI family protein
MKRIILFVGILVTIIAINVCVAQNTEGIITYEVTVNMHRTLPPDRQDMKAMIPQYRTFKQQLFFNTAESLYKPLIEEEDEEEEGGGGGRMRMRQPRTVTYYNQSTSQLLAQQDMMGKKYLITDSLKVSPWKFGTESKTIQGYECKQAYFTDEERKQTITAWYTDKLRPFLGPDKFISLPGAVLAVDINNGERVTAAVKIELRPLKKNEMKVPTDGQKVTQAEFRKQMEEQRKRSGNNGGPVLIRN